MPMRTLRSASRSRRSCRNRLDQGKPCARRPFGVILVGARIAEIDHRSIAHPFGDVAVEAGDGGRDRTLKGADQVGHVLGIEAGRQLGRADQVAEQDRQLPPFEALGEHC